MLAAGRGVKRWRNSADLAAPGESVVREYLQSGGSVRLALSLSSLFVLTSGFGAMPVMAQNACVGKTFTVSPLSFQFPAKFFVRMAFVLLIGIAVCPLSHYAKSAGKRDRLADT